MTNKNELGFLNNIYLPGDRIFTSLPDQDEARKTTSELHVLAKEIAESLLSSKCTIIMFGSAAYGANYSTTKNSDLDLEIIVENVNDEFSKLSFLDGHEDMLEQLNYFSESSAQMLLYKMIYKEKDISLHFIKKDEFEKLTNVDLLNPMVKKGITELRNYYKGNSTYLNRCSFTNKSTKWISDNKQLENGLFLLDLPFYQIENGLLYNGIFPEWHLANPIFLGGDSAWYSTCENRLFRKYVERMVAEENLLGIELKFTNILARKQRMSPTFLDEINLKADLIKKDLQK